MALPRLPSFPSARPRSGRGLGRAVLAGGAVAAAALPVLIGAHPAYAQGAGCGNRGGLATAEISIEEPAAGSTVSRPDIRVRGRATASLGLLNRVEVTVAGVTRPSQFAPGGALAFDVPFDLSNIAAGQVTVRVVACGTQGLTGVLAQEEKEISFTFQPSAPTSTSPTTLPTAPAATVLPSVGSQGGTTGTTVAVSTTRPGQASTTTATSTPPSTETPAPVEEDRPEPVRPKADSNAPLVLTEADDDGSSGPPLWVGAVVGVSGGLGLLFSASSSRRRGREARPPVEPVDPDLVDVR